MPRAAARRLCPKLIVLPGDFEKYELFSRLMFSYAYDFTPDVEIGSIDEGYFDLTGTRKPALSIARNIRQAIRQALKLSVSEGIAANKLVSQIASKLKKPSAFEFVPQGEEANFLAPLGNQWLPGIGPKTSVQLNSAGLARIGQIALTPMDLLGLLVGKAAPQLLNFSLGIDERPIVPVRAPAKSYSEQETFEADTTDAEFLEATLRRMADKLMARVRQDGKSIRTITVKARYNDMDEEQAAESLVEPTDLESDIYSLVCALLKKAWSRRVSLRLVSLKLSNVYDGRFSGGLALDNATRQHAAQQRLAGVVDTLRRKHGRAILMRGHDFILRAKHNRGEEPSTASPSVTIAAERSPRFQAAAGNQRLLKPGRDARTTPVLTVTPGVELRLRIHLPQPSEPRKTPLPPRNDAHTKFAPLNFHSYYSFLDSTLSVKAIVELARRHELPAVALTDHNNLHGAVEFAQAAAEAGIKPIIGAEIHRHGRRACLYVQNQKGYRNLCRILNALNRPAAQESAECRDRSPLEALLENHTEGLIAVSTLPELASFFAGRFYF